MKFLFLIIISAVNLFSQIPLAYTLKPDAIPVTGKSGLYQNPFAGGIDNPRFQFVDIDGDQDLDLFIIDSDEVFQFYKCEGVGIYKLVPYINFGIQTINWIKFIDIDADGDLDCFGNNLNLGITFNKNIGSKTNPIFQLISNGIKDTSNNFVSCEFYAVPDFADIDADGDYDLFSGTSNGQVTFYENIGTSVLFKFRYVTDYWQQLNIQGIGGIVQKEKFNQQKHGSCVLEFFDADSNNTIDLFWGDFFNSSLYYLQNIGTKTQAKMVLRDSTYPKESPVKTAGFNMTQHLDYDGDKKIDLIVGSLFFTQSTNSFIFYKNTGSNKLPYYQLASNSLLPMVDVGSRSFPTFCDIEGDGDQDLLVGGDRGNITLFTNIGNNTNPHFNGNDNVIATLVSSYYVTPTAGDLNNDGKHDLLVGDYSGNIRFFKNTSLGNNISFSLESFTLDTLDVGSNSAPLLADITNDSLLDLLIGNSAGKIIFYKNIGTKSIPKFQLTTGVTDSIDVGFDATPAIIKFDNRNYLVAGNSGGEVFCFVNKGSSNSPSFEKLSTSSFIINTSSIKLNSAPVFVQLDKNYTVPSLFLGNGKGGLLYFTGSIYNSVDRKITPSEFQLFQNYPNPFNNETIIKFQIPLKSKVTLKIYNILGKEIATLVDEEMEEGLHFTKFTANYLSSGSYFYTLKFHTFGVDRTLTEKMILLK